MHHERNEATVFRQVAFPVSAFDHLKNYQRSYQACHGIRPNNNQCLALILAEHQQAATASLLKASPMLSHQRDNLGGVQ